MAVGWRYSNLSCIMKQHSGGNCTIYCKWILLLEIIWNKCKSPGSQQLQVDTELVGKMTSPSNTKYCKWILNYLKNYKYPKHQILQVDLKLVFKKIQVPISQILQVDNWATKKFHKSQTHHLLQVATEHSKKIQTTSQVFNSSDLSSWQDKSPSQKA